MNQWSRRVQSREQPTYGRFAVDQRRFAVAMEHHALTECGRDRVAYIVNNAIVPNGDPQLFDFTQTVRRCLYVHLGMQKRAGKGESRKAVGWIYEEMSSQTVVDLGVAAGTSSSMRAGLPRRGSVSNFEHAPRKLCTVALYDRVLTINRSVMYVSANISCR